MWKRAAKIGLPSQKSVILGLVFVLLALILSCGYVQTNDHSVAVAKGAECDRAFSFANLAPTKDSGLFFMVLFLSFIALALLIRGNLLAGRHPSIFSSPSLIYLKATKHIPKLYNPILQALRRGILQPKIYDLAVS